MDAVIGAGGPTGRECVNRLAQVGRPVKAVVRSPEKYKDAFTGSGITIVKGDVESLNSLKEALAGVNNIIFAASGKGYFSARAVDELGVGTVAEAAKAVGAKHIVLVSSALVTPQNRWGLMDSKFRGENLLRKSGVAYTIVRPGGLTNGPALTGALCINQGDRVAGRVSRADVAAVAVAALSDPSAAGVTFELSSKAELPPANQLASIFEGLAKD